MISVVIPAHNEARVLERCLGALLDGAGPDELEIVVVCNGCTDDTEDVARSFGRGVRVLSSPVASKTSALNLGDDDVTGFPRIYVDADVELGIEAVRAVASVLERGVAEAASPGLHIDASGSSRVVRAYFRFWAELPSVKGDLVGRGVYAVSRKGRARFDVFPDVLADDHFIRSTFPRSTRVTVPSVQSTVRAPATFAALLRRSVRVHAGNAESRRAEPDLGLTREVPGWLRVIGSDPRRLVDAPAYGAVKALARAGAWSMRLRGRVPSWGRDDTTR